MSPPPLEMKKTSAVTPRKTMRGHTGYIFGVVHLPGGQRIITCSKDGSLRLWELENGAQIGDEWRDEGDKAEFRTIALSPNGKTLASGSNDGTVRLWDVETGKVVVKWKGHSKAKMIATGGPKESGIKIWDAKTGKLLSTIEQDWAVCSLAWISDEKKLIAGTGNGLIKIFNTATWQQIVVLEGHTITVYSLTLFPNDRLLASTSWDYTARLWNLDTNLQVGPPLRHKKDVRCSALSADGKLLSTGCDDKNAYVWDILAILKAAGLEGLLGKVYVSSHGSSSEEHISRSSLAISGRSLTFLEVDATQGFGHASELSPRFFDNTQANARSSTKPSARALDFSALLGRFPSLPHRSRHKHTTETQLPPAPSESRLHVLLNRLRSSPNVGTNEIPELPQPPMLSRFRPQVLLSHLSLLLPRPQLYNDEATEPQRSQTPSESHPGALIGHLSSLFRSASNADEATEPQRSQTPSESRPGALIGRLSSLSRSAPNVDEAIELQHCLEPATFSHRSSHVVNVSAMRDREVIFVARRPETASEMAKRVKNPKPWVRVVFFLCCVSPGTDDSPGTNDTPRST